MNWEQIVTPGAYQTNYYALPPLATALLIVSLSGFVLAKDPGKRPNRSFFRFGLSLFIWLLGYSLMYISGNDDTAQFWLLFSYIGVIFVPATAVDCSVNVTGQGIEPSGVRVRTTSFYLISSICYAFVFFFPDDFFSGWKVYFWGRYPIYGWGGISFLIYFISAAIFSLFVCLKNLSRTRDKAYRNRTIYFFSAILIGYLAGVDFIAKFGLTVYPFGYVPVLLLFSIVTYAIIRHHLMDIQTMVHKTLLWATLSSLLLVPFFGIIVLMRPWLHGAPTLLLSVFLAGLLVLTYFYYQIVQPVIDHLFQRGEYDLQKGFEKLFQKISTLEDIRMNGKEIVETLVNMLYVDQAAFFLLDEKGQSFQPVEKAGPIPDHTIQVDDHFIKWLFWYPRVLEIHAIDESLTSDEVKESARSYFAHMGTVICIPLGKQVPCMGLLHLGPKTNLEPYYETDLHLLEKLRVKANEAIGVSS